MTTRGHHGLLMAASAAGSAFGAFDPARTDLAKITLSAANKRAIYSTANDVPGSSAALSSPILGGSSATDRVFEVKINSCVVYVYIGTWFGALAGFNPAESPSVASGKFLKFTGDGNNLQVSDGSGGSAAISPAKVGRYADRFGIRVDSRYTSTTEVRHRFYRNGSLIYTSGYQVIGNVSSDAGVVVIGAGRDAWSANGFDVQIETDPALMAYYSSYGGAVGWPAT